MLKTGDRVVQVHDGLRGSIVATSGDGLFYVQFDNGDDVEDWREDDLCDELGWDKAGSDLKAERNAERKALGGE